MSAFQVENTTQMFENLLLVCDRFLHGRIDSFVYRICSDTLAPNYRTVFQSKTDENFFKTTLI